ncbi:hypothetical protein [Helicobacter cynogastricus]|uniref:hypothetical protein n=1 Tax=Helicobacter cynogastricus TaxID=329937 RepID=UPI000CF08DC6|nr:hypothetical protein [Helicobacter cynogastricus]
MRWALLLGVCLHAAPIITLDTQANAKLATSNANESTMIAKLQESLRLYEHLLEQAKGQLTTLETTRKTLERSEAFAYAYNLAPQESMLAHLHAQLTQAQERQTRFEALTQRYNNLEKRHYATLKRQCPWLDFEKGEIIGHSIQAQNAQTLLQKLEHNPQNASLTGFARASFLCEASLQNQAKLSQATRVKEMQSALLVGDFKRYSALQTQYDRAHSDLKETQRARLQSDLASILTRTQQMRAFFSSNALQTRLQTLHATLASQLQEAQGPIEQAQAYSQYAHQAQTLQLELLLELTRQLHFLNETMAMGMSFLGARLANPAHFPLNTYGFPALSP